jgi:uncharacterized protein YuzE
MFLRLDETPIIESEEVRPGVILDFNKEGKVVGVEILDVSTRSDDAMKSFFYEVA